MSKEANFPGIFSPDSSWKRVKKTPFISLTNFQAPAKNDLSFYLTSYVGFDKPLKLVTSLGPGTVGNFASTLNLSSPRQLPLDSSNGHKIVSALHIFKIEK